jgi:SAM-dependent methyltransferase
MPSAAPRFEDVTETTGIPVTAEGARMMYTRYALAADLAKGRRVLELACGGGNGLGLVGANARYLVGGDYSRPLLRMARAHYGSRFPLAQLSAEALPFRDGVFDVVLFFEASYYVPVMEQAFDEVTRVLAPSGKVLFVNANPERPDFIVSPHSVHYHTADEFRAALEQRRFAVEMSGAFPVDAARSNPTSRAIGAILGAARIVLQRLGMVPKTLRGRARLKRLVYWKLEVLPPELPPGFAPVEHRVPLGRGPVRGFKVIYIVGRRSQGRLR